MVLAFCVDTQDKTELKAKAGAVCTLETAD